MSLLVGFTSDQSGAVCHGLGDEDEDQDGDKAEEEDESLSLFRPKICEIEGFIRWITESSQSPCKILYVMIHA